MQPLKAVAAITITLGLSGQMVTQAGLILGVFMLLLTLTGCIEYILKTVPECVIRGIQFGLGIKLALLALTVFIPSYGYSGLAISAICMVFLAFYSGSIKFPPLLIVLIAGAFAGTFLLAEKSSITGLLGYSQQSPGSGYMTLVNLIPLVVIPQIALSIGNSLLATRKLADDFFPAAKVTVKKLSLTYSFFNMLIPFLGGIPVCHGSGGLAGHYRFGARTGGSLIIYGIVLITLGVSFHENPALILKILPLPILGVILFFEGITVGRMVIKTRGIQELSLAAAIGLICAFVEYGFILGLVLGTLSYFTLKYLEKSYSTGDEN